MILLLLTSIALAKTNIAVVDMGIDSSFTKTLKPYIVSGIDYGLGQRTSGIDYSYQYEKEYHGTFIAWLIARPDLSTKNINLIDVVYSDYLGNMFNLNKLMFPESNLQLYRQKRAHKEFSLHLAKVFRDSINQGANIINFSSADRSFDSEELKEEIKTQKDVLFVVSAGNDDIDLDQLPTYPCSYELENVICVGSVNKKGNKETYSNYGKVVDIYTRSSYSNGYEGTSFASPIISRSLALIRNKNPNMKVKDLKKELFQYVTKKDQRVIFDYQTFNKRYP